jgi:protease-4
MSSLHVRVVGLFALLLLPGCVLVTGSFSLFDSAPQPLEERVVSGEGPVKVLLIDIANVISSVEDRDGLSFITHESTLARVEAELELARKDDAIRAVVLRINSPGGTVHASDAIFYDMSRFGREKNVPIVAYFQDVAASGGYYVALSADEIVASPSTVTGSVGAVMYGINARGLMKIVGVENQTIKSGEKKDIGSPLREMTPDERAVLQSVIDGMRDRFVGLVKDRRPNVTDAALDTISDGRVFGANEALSIGLVDRIGYLQDAIDVAKRRSNIAEAQVVMYRRPREYAETIYSQAKAPPMELSLLRIGGSESLPTPSFLYMWMPDPLSAGLGSLR